MRIHNYMEDITPSLLEDILRGREGVCSCQQCKADIVALALNKLPAKYVVTQKGMAYTKLSELEQQFKADVVKELTMAMEVVKKKPHHG